MTFFQRPILSSLILLIALPALFAACATTPFPKHEEASSNSPGALKNSGVDIHYVLGHSHRRFVVLASATGYLAQSYHDHQILKEGQVDQPHYSEFLSKATQFIASPHRIPADQGPAAEDCRSPFKVTVRIGTESKVFQGCRNADEGALSHLVRDGEFLLLHSKK